jgi:hypothetical protein
VRADEFDKLVGYGLYKEVKFIINHEIGFVFTIAIIRKASLDKGIIGT